MDSWADVASFGEDEPLPAFGAGPCMSTANNDGFQLPSHVTKKLARQQRRTKQTTGTKQLVGLRPVDTSAGSAALQAVPRPIVAFVGRLNTDTTAENLQQHLTDMDIRGTRCTKLEAKDGRVFSTAAFRVCCDPAYKDLFYNEATGQLVVNYVIGYFTLRSNLLYAYCNSGVSSLIVMAHLSLVSYNLHGFNQGLPML